MLNKIIGGVALALGFMVVGGATRATDWGGTFKEFTRTCATLGGVVHGKSYGATCAYNGGLASLPAAHPGWTVTVAQGTVAMWRGGGKVVEEASNGTVIVACQDAQGQSLRLWEEGCVRQ